MQPFSPNAGPRHTVRDEYQIILLPTSQPFSLTMRVALIAIALAVVAVAVVAVVPDTDRDGILDP